MILEEIVSNILKEEMPKIDRNVKWDGMYDHISEKIVKSIKESIFE